MCSLIPHPPSPKGRGLERRLKSPLLRRVDCRSHLAHGMIQSDEHRAGDDVVADVEFGDLADACDRAHVAISESVSCRDMQPVLSRERRGFAQASKFLICAHRAFAMYPTASQCRFGVSSGAQFDLLSVHFVRRFNLVWVGIDEETRHYP